VGQRRDDEKQQTCESWQEADDKRNLPLEGRQLNGAARRAGLQRTRDTQLEVSIAEYGVGAPNTVLLLFTLQLELIQRLAPGHAVREDPHHGLGLPSASTGRLADGTGVAQRVALQFAQVRIGDMGTCHHVGEGRGRAERGAGEMWDARRGVSASHGGPSREREGIKRRYRRP